MAKKQLNGSAPTRSLARAVRSVLDAQRELKFQSESQAGNVAAAGAIFDLTQNIVQGDGSTNRDGAQINLTKIALRFEAALNASAAGDFVRIIVFVDKMNTGVAPVRADVLLLADPNSVYTANVYVYKRFTILHDKTYGMSINGNSRIIQSVNTLNCKGMKVSYLGTTDAAASNGRNSVWALIIGNEVTNVSTFSIDVGMMFHDS